MKRVILTGGTGFVGANLAHRLLAEGHEVHLFCRPGYKDWRIASIAGAVQIHVLDFGDGEDLKTRVKNIQPDWIFHLAAYGAYSSQSNLRLMVEANTIAAMNLVNACLETGFEAFINTGSSSEYGYKDHAPSEDELLEPNSTYAVTKASATHYCGYIARQHRANLATLRLYSAFGAYEEPTRLIPTLILAGFQNRLPPLVNPSIARDFVFIEDVVDAYLLAALQPQQLSGKVYNVGSGVQTSLAQVVEAARRLLSISAEPNWGTMPDRQWDTSVWVADHSRITRDLGWKPKHTFENGFMKTIAWFQTDSEMLYFYKNHQESPH